MSSPFSPRRFANLFRSEWSVPAARRRSRGSPPLLEALEDRVTPATYTVNVTTDAGSFLTGVGSGTTGSTYPAFVTTPNDRYIAQVYLDLLGRAVDEVGMQVWAGQLNVGVPATTVVFSIQHSASNEFQTGAIKTLYEYYLHRAPDSNGLLAALGLVDSGGTYEQLAAVLTGSPEYFQNRGAGENRGFLTALYSDTLGRQIYLMEEGTFLSLLNSGTTKEQIAYDVLRSQEYDIGLVKYLYETFLRRPADSTGLDEYVTALQNGVTDQEIIASLLASPEYMNHVVVA